MEGEDFFRDRVHLGQIKYLIIEPHEPGLQFVPYLYPEEEER